MFVAEEGDDKLREDHSIGIVFTSLRERPRDFISTTGFVNRFQSANHLRLKGGAVGLRYAGRMISEGCGKPIGNQVNQFFVNREHISAVASCRIVREPAGGIWRDAE